MGSGKTSVHELPLLLLFSCPLPPSVAAHSSLGRVSSFPGWEAPAALILTMGGGVCWRGRSCRMGTMPCCLNSSHQECYKGIVLVSCGCCDNLPQTGWFKTTKVYPPSSGGQKFKIHFTGPEARCVGRAVLPSEALEKNLVLFQLTGSASIPCLMISSLGSLPLSLHHFLFCECVVSSVGIKFFFAVFLIRTLMIAQRSHLNTPKITSPSQEH